MSAFEKEHNPLKVLLYILVFRQQLRVVLLNDTNIIT